MLTLANAVSGISIIISIILTNNQINGRCVTCLFLLYKRISSLKKTYLCDIMSYGHFIKIFTFVE